MSPIGAHVTHRGTYLTAKEVYFLWSCSAKLKLNFLRSLLGEVCEANYQNKQTAKYIWRLTWLTVGDVFNPRTYLVFLFVRCTNKVQKIEFTSPRRCHMIRHSRGGSFRSFRSFRAKILQPVGTGTIFPFFFFILSASLSCGTLRCLRGVRNPKYPFILVFSYAKDIFILLFVFSYAKYIQDILRKLILLFVFSYANP
jgi:hypothetical protein